MEGCGHTGFLQRYCTKAVTHQTPTCNGFWGCSRLFSCRNINVWKTGESWRTSILILALQHIAVIEIS